MKQIIIMVGLPARGKSFISNKIFKYLNWSNINTKIFNVGNYRRSKYKYNDSSFFDHNIKKNINIRNELALELYNELLEWIKKDNNTIAIFDATNTSIERRLNLCKITPSNINLLFIESICNLPSIINKNIMLKSNSIDYINIEKNEAYTDFEKRIKFYENIYISINKEENIRFIKIININEEFILNLNNIVTNYDKIIINNLLNNNINRKKIFLTRHGESLYNLENKIGGNSDLSKNGILYAKKLAIYMNNTIKNYELYCSTLIRTINTSKELTKNIKICKCLDEINAGIFENKSFDEVEELYTEEFNERQNNKLNYRYPSGESYLDLIDRLRTFVFDIENNNNIVIIIAHQAILRVIYGYFMGIKIEDIPYIKIPLHTIIELNPDTYNYNSKYIEL
jgi:6-phosphofructo-2-kinase / fructose-2,6-biphosphatase 2